MQLYLYLLSSITLCSTPANTSIGRCLKSLTSCTFFLVDRMLNYAPDFVVNWIDVITDREPRIWCAECIAGDVTQLQCIAALHTLQTTIAVYDT